MVSTATLKMLPLVPYQSDKDTLTTGTQGTPDPSECPYNNRVNQTTQMTDSDKLFALTEIMGDVLCTLELKQYDIEDPQLSHDCVVDADKFRQRMLDILHSEDT